MTTSPEKRERAADVNPITGLEHPERRSSERISGHDLWLAHNALLQYVAGLEAAGDSMARIIGSIESELPSVKMWKEARKSHVRPVSDASDGPRRLAADSGRAEGEWR